MALNLRLFSNICSAASLEELPDLERIWKQYDIQASGGAARRQHSTSDNPGTAAVLSKAAANCLRLLMHQQQQAAGTDAMPPWTMPRAAAHITAVRTTQHIFARFTSDWMQAVIAANNAGRCQQARSSVEHAVQEAGAVA